MTRFQFISLNTVSKPYSSCIEYCIEYCVIWGLYRGKKSISIIVANHIAIS